MYSARSTKTKPQGISSQSLYELLLTCFLLSIYTEAPLFVSDNVYIPSFVTLLLLAPILGAVFWNRIYMYEAKFVVAIVLVLSMSALLSPGFTFINQKLLGLAQTVLSITAGVLLVKLIDRLEKKRVLRVLLSLSVILVAGAILETLGVLREASDAFRHAAYAKLEATGSYGVYNDYARDLGITGFERPNFFASEPSLVAIGFLAFVNSWLSIVPTRRNYLAALALSVLLFLVVGSPIVIGSALVSTAIIFYSEKHFIHAVVVAAILSMLTVAIVWLSPELIDNTLWRFERLFSMSFTNGDQLAMDSEGLRLILPFIALVDVWANSPLFGTGISGKEVASLYSRFSLPPETVMGINCFPRLFTYLGAIGSSLFIWTFVTYLRRSGIREIMLLAVMVVGLAMTMGAFESPRFWGYVFLFIGAMRIRSKYGTKVSEFANKRVDLIRYGGSS